MAEVTSGHVTVIVLDDKEVMHLANVMQDFVDTKNEWHDPETIQAYEPTFHALFELGQALGVSFIYEGE